MWQAHHVKNPYNYIRNRQKCMAPTVSQIVIPKTSYARTWFILWVCQDLMVIMFQKHQATDPLTSLASQLQEMDYSILDTPSLTLWSKGKERTIINLYCPCSAWGTNQGRHGHRLIVTSWMVIWHGWAKGNTMLKETTYKMPIGCMVSCSRFSSLSPSWESWYFPWQCLTDTSKPSQL